MSKCVFSCTSKTVSGDGQSTALVKVHNRNPTFLVDCDVSGVDESTEVN